MTLEQFTTMWKDFKSGHLTIVTARGVWEIEHGKDQLKIVPSSELFVYQKTEESPKFMFDVSAIDHVRHDA